MKKIHVEGGPYQQMRTTIGLVGKAIVDGSRYLPIRNLACRLAADAPAKDYFRQAKSIFDHLVKRQWKYVRDPVNQELVTTSPEALYKYVLAGDGVGVGNGIGAGDCDDIAAGTGALLYSIGFPVRLATTAPVGVPAGNMFGHIFVQTQIPRVGWVTVDPVVYPKNGFGFTPPNSRIAFYDLTGRLISKHGNAQNLNGWEEQDMGYNTGYSDAGFAAAMLPDMGLAGIESASPMNMPEDWRDYGIPDFGSYSEIDGVISGDEIEPLAAEVSYEFDGVNLYSRTPILELARKDYNYVKRNRVPYHGMMALGDDLETYAFDGELGFFKKLFRRAKRGVRRVRKRIRGGIKKILKKIPGGKKLIRLGKKIWKVAHKIVKPLTKFVGKYAAKLAPVAALIPGFGPAVAAGLYTAGKVANIMNKYGVKLKGAAGSIRKLAFPSATIASKFRKELSSAARKEAGKQAGKRRRRRPRPGRRLRRAFSRR